jgi:hypothetical protein
MEDKLDLLFQAHSKGNEYKRAAGELSRSAKAIGAASSFLEYHTGKVTKQPRRLGTTLMLSLDQKVIPWSLETHLQSRHRFQSNKRRNEHHRRQTYYRNSKHCEQIGAKQRL